MIRSKIARASANVIFGFRQHSLHKRWILQRRSSGTLTRQRIAAKQVQERSRVPVRGLAPTDPVRQSALLTQQIAALGKRSQWQQALCSLIQAGCKGGLIQYNAAINGCGVARRWDAALALYARMHKVKLEPDVITCGSVIKACGQAGCWKIADGIFHRMGNQKLAPDSLIYTSLIKSSGEASNWGKSLALIDQMRQQMLRPDMVIWSVLVSACGTASRWEQALSLFGQMKLRNICPNVITYGALLKTFGSVSKWQKSVAMFNSMLTQRVSPNLFIYTALIKNSGEAGCWPLALHFFDCLRWGGLRPDVVACNSLLSAFRGSQENEEPRWALAMNFLEEIRSKYQLCPTLVTWSSLATTCSKAAQWERALSILGQVHTQSLRPDKVLYGSLMHACGQASRWDLSLFLLEHELPQKNLKPDSFAYGMVIMQISERGAWAPALFLLGCMLSQKMQPSPQMCISVMKACVAAGEGERARQLAGYIAPQAVAAFRGGNTSP